MQKPLFCLLHFSSTNHKKNGDKIQIYLYTFQITYLAEGLHSLGYISTKVSGLNNISV